MLETSSRELTELNATKWKRPKKAFKVIMGISEKENVKKKKTVNIQKQRKLHNRQT